jgi:hypothetical protein
MKRLLLSTALVMAVGVAVGGVYLDTSTVKQQARQLQVRQFTLQDIDRAVYGPDGLTNPQLKIASVEDKIIQQVQGDPNWRQLVGWDDPIKPVVIAAYDPINLAQPLHQERDQKATFDERFGTWPSNVRQVNGLVIADAAIDRAYVPDPVIDRTHVTDPVVDRENKTDEAFDRARAPMQYTYGPVMVALDPEGRLVMSSRPLRLEPKEYSAQASSPLPADCPQPNAADDTAFCQ